MGGDGPKSGDESNALSGLSGGKKKSGFHLVLSAQFDLQVPVPVTCLGGHETSAWPCFCAKPASCGRRCGRHLPCGNHVCERDCHRVKNAASASAAGATCRRCERPCELPRKQGVSPIRPITLTQILVQRLVDIFQYTYIVLDAYRLLNWDSFIIEFQFCFTAETNYMYV